MIITSPQYNRPSCSQQMIESLKTCIGIEDCHIIFVCEPTCQSVIDICKDAKLPSFEVIVNDKCLGLWENKKKCLKLGFEKSDFVFHLEDDLLVSRDCIKFVQWAAKTYQEDSSIFSISCFNKTNKGDLERSKDEQKYLRIQRRQFYTSIGFGIWADRYKEFADKWSGSDHHIESFRGNRQEVFPFLSRINHIGHVQGICFDDELAASILRSGNHPTCLSAISTAENIQWINRPQLIANKFGREWVKLNDNFCRTRDSEEFYRKHYFLDCWAETESYVFGEFVE